MKSFLIIVQIILFQKDKHDYMTKCVLLNQTMIATTTKNEKIRKKKTTTQVKKKENDIKIKRANKR